MSAAKSTQAWRAPWLSRKDMLSAAENGDLQSLAVARPAANGTAKVLSQRHASRWPRLIRLCFQQIDATNERAIGLLEHQRRSKGRDLDMAAVGRRAVAAYSGIRPQR